MTEGTYVIVDSNIIIDIVQRDPQWMEWSLNALIEHEAAKVNPIIYAEICYQKTSVDEANQILEALQIEFEELPREALFLASQAYRHYRKLGGTNTAPLPDFFIGAHAAAKNVPIITRDVSRYQTYFPMVKLICP